MDQDFIEEESPFDRTTVLDTKKKQLASAPARGVFDMVPIKKAIIRLGKAMLSVVLASMGTPPARGRSCTPLLESEERVRIGEKPKKLRSHTLNRVTRLAMKTGRR